MTRTEYTIKTAYIFDPAHKGAPYSLNGGENWTNGGELKEVLLKACLGFEAKKDACGSYDKTDDVPEIGASVKSSKATLVNKVLGYDFESVKRHYFATVHSTQWVYVSISDETLIAYYMNAEEFEKFMDNWASFDKDRKVIRFKTESGKMIRWLDERA
jgi:hypothetical protein